MTYFFIHIPKTSGTTFIDVLQNDHRNNIGYFYPPKEEMHLFEKRTKEGPFYHLAHNPNWEKFNYIVGHFTFGIHEIFKAKDFSYIGVIREPVSHYVSTYKAYLRMSDDFQSIILPESKLLDDFLKLNFTHNMQTFYLSGLSIKEIREDKERAYETAIENTRKYFSGIYPTERFDEALFYFKKKIGIKPLPYRRRNVAFNKINQTIHPQVIERIREVNDIDLRLYEYLNNEFSGELKRIPFLSLKVLHFRAQNRIYSLRN